MAIPDFTGKQVLVTGGAGFIGSHLVDALVSRGAKVSVLDNLSNGHEENLAAVRADIRFICGDIRNPEDCASAVDGSVFVFHLAAVGSVPRSMKDPVTTIDVNVRGTAIVFNACREAKVKRVTYASSSSVYGDSTLLPKKEGQEGRPLSPYGLSKVENERLAELFSRLYGMEIVGLRYFNVYGPRQDPNGPYAAVVPRFIAALRRGEAPIIYGDGEQSRDFTAVDDVVRANLLATGAPSSAAGRAFNVAAGGRTTVKKVALALARILETETAPVHVDARPGDILHSQADPALAREVLGWDARVDLEAGLRKTIAET
ncbi:MAG TPA: SDR family oxidoreductase [Thermoanaerobaculia bacterium]|nr:SDR family oxidoreductase [Thermoanaerobaculia bacterium]